MIFLWPGILLAGTIAAAASFVSSYYGAPAMLFALLIGMTFNIFILDNSRIVPGVEYCTKTVLRAGVALLGIRISITDFMEFGLRGMALTTSLVLVTIASGVLFSRMLQKSWRFGLLSGCAVAICGASAALAVSALIARGRTGERDTLFTVIAVTSLSTLAMVSYPILFGFLDMSDKQIGFLLGATIHDVAQVVGAGFLISQEVGDAATVTKLFRIALLPIILIIISVSLGASRRRGGAPMVPYFLVAFAVLAVINSFVSVPLFLTDSVETASRAMLLIAIAALGIKTSLKEMFAMGGKKLVSISASTLFLLGCAVVAASLFLT